MAPKASWPREESPVVGFPHATPKPRARRDLFRDQTKKLEVHHVFFGNSRRLGHNLQSRGGEEGRRIGSVRVRDRSIIA